MNLKVEQQDFQAAGALADELPYWGWLKEHPFCLTRAGELFCVARMAPAVIDGRTPDQLDQILGRWQRVLSQLDPRTRLYFYLLRRPASLLAPSGLEGVAQLSQENRRAFLLPRIQDLQTYVVWSTNPGLEQAAAHGPNGGPWLVDYGRNWLRARRNPHESAYLAAELRQAAIRFRQLVDASAALADDVTPLTILPAAEATAFLSELVNRPGLAWQGDGAASGLNWRLALSELEAERQHLRLDGEPVILYSLNSPPVTAKANLLEELNRLEAQLTITLEWRPQSLAAARRKIRSAQRHYFQKRYSMMAHVQDAEGSANAMVDTAAEAESSRLGSALVELEADGIAYGDLALTVALHGELTQTERLDAELRRIFAGCDAKVIREGYGQLPTWFARMPAMPRKRQIRSVFASAGVAACLAPIFGPPKGQPISGHLSKPVLATFETRWRTPFFYDLFAGDVGHTLILGATGAGKSFLLNYLLVQSLQYAPPRPDPGPWRLLPLAHPVPRGRLPPARARPRRWRARAQAVHPACRRTHSPVPHRLDHPPAQDRRLPALRRRPIRDPCPDRGPLRLRIGRPLALCLRQVAPETNVAGHEPLVRRRRVGRLLRQPRRRGNPTRRLAGDRPRRRGRTRGPLRSGALLPPGADAPRPGTTRPRPPASSSWW